ncbi:CapA family protein [Enterococcus sp. LJL90]
MEFLMNQFSNIKDYDNPILYGDYGLGNILILLIILQNIESGDLLLADTVKVDSTIAKESNEQGSIGFSECTEYSLAELLPLQIVNPVADVSLLLAKLFREKTRKSAQAAMDFFVESNNLTANCCKNISGRKKRNDEQNFTINDLQKIGLAFSCLKKEVKHYLLIREYSFQKKIYQIFSNYGKTSQEYILYWRNHVICFDDETIKIIANAESELIRDQRLTEDSQIFFYKGNLLELQSKKFAKADVDVFIAGDTYLGEWYSKKRVRKKQWDPLNEKGYKYSFEKLRELYEKSDFRIINFEAVLTDDLAISPLKRKKNYILGALTQPTINILKSENMDLVTLATNHCGDYGQSGMEKTIKEFEKNGIFTLGGGDFQKATSPFKLTTTKQEILIFNGYWYRKNQFLNNDLYAYGNHLGGAAINSDFIKRIVTAKKEYPKMKIFVICHWGVDFQEIDNYQQTVATHLLEAGVDLIIGHGPHTIQPMSFNKNENILYSLGNFIFNSNGEFAAFPKALPYGIVSHLLLRDEHATLKLQFIEAENKKTLWQPKKIDEIAFTEIINKWNKSKIEESNWSIDSKKLTIEKEIW